MKTAGPHTPFIGQTRLDLEAEKSLLAATRCECWPCDHPADGAD